MIRGGTHAAGGTVVASLRIPRGRLQAAPLAARASGVLQRAIAVRTGDDGQLGRGLSVGQEPAIAGVVTGHGAATRAAAPVGTGKAHVAFACIERIHHLYRVRITRAVVGDADDGSHLAALGHRVRALGLGEGEVGGVGRNRVGDGIRVVVGHRIRGGGGDIGLVLVVHRAGHVGNRGVDDDVRARSGRHGGRVAGHHLPGHGTVPAGRGRGHDPRVPRRKGIGDLHVGGAHRPFVGGGEGEADGTIADHRVGVHALVHGHVGTFDHLQGVGCGIVVGMGIGHAGGGHFSRVGDEAHGIPRDTRAEMEGAGAVHRQRRAAAGDPLAGGGTGPVAVLVCRRIGIVGNEAETGGKVVRQGETVRRIGPGVVHLEIVGDDAARRRGRIAAVLGQHQVGALDDVHLVALAIIVQVGVPGTDGRGGTGEGTRGIRGGHGYVDVEEAVASQRWPVTGHDVVRPPTTGRGAGVAAVGVVHRDESEPVRYRDVERRVDGLVRRVVLEVHQVVVLADGGHQRIGVIEEADRLAIGRGNRHLRPQQCRSHRETREKNTTNEPALLAVSHSMPPCGRESIPKTMILVLIRVLKTRRGVIQRFIGPPGDRNPGL